MSNQYLNVTHISEVPNAEDMREFHKKKRKKSRSEPKPIVTPEERIRSLIFRASLGEGFYIYVRSRDLKLVIDLLENIFQPASFFETQLDFEIYRYNWLEIQSQQDLIEQEELKVDRKFVLTSARAAFKVLEVCNEKKWKVF